MWQWSLWLEPAPSPNGRQEAENGDRLVRVMMDDVFWLSDALFARLAPLLPTDTRGAARVDDRRVISGIVRGGGCRGPGTGCNTIPYPFLAVNCGLGGSPLRPSQLARPT